MLWEAITLWVAQQNPVVNYPKLYNSGAAVRDA